MAVAGTQHLIKKHDVYVAAVPLRAAKGPPQLLMSVAYSLNLSWDLQHFMAIIKPTTNNTSTHPVVVFDFQPKDPENVFTALAVMSGRSVPGVVRRRKLTKLPRTKCWHVGSSSRDVAEEVAAEFGQKWITELKVGHHDCRHYTNGLVEALTGEKLVLEQLRRRNVVS
ncbi:hypothetical protein LINGRAHAP2_LOCUS35766 [Linum grandiflorum]